jgi:hypothetical protein
MVSPYPYGLIERIVCHPTCTSDLVNYGSQSFCAMSTLLLGSPERLQEFLGACRRAGIRPNFNKIPNPALFSVKSSPPLHQRPKTVLQRLYTLACEKKDKNPRAETYLTSLGLVDEFLANK